MKNTYLLFALLSFLNSFSQSIKIVDSDTQQPISFANIFINSTESLISNTEGYFAIPSSYINEPSTIITVSNIGYDSRRLSLKNIENEKYIIHLTPTIYSLNEVIVPNKRPNPTELMTEVNKRLQENYQMHNQSNKNTIFYRESTSFLPKKLEFEIDKSSGFTKVQLAKANSDLKIFAKSLISSPPRQYTDVLSSYYMRTKLVDGKMQSNYKLDVIKATKLSDESRSTNMEDLQKGFGKIVLQHLDTTKYYRIKSGLFGSNDTISLRKGFKNKKQKKRTNVSSAKAWLVTFVTKNNPASGKLDFVSNHKYYDFVYEGAELSPENTFIYILSFKPRKGKAKYSGKVYISETDYAILRTDFTLADGKTLGGINLKLILGVKASDNLSTGTLIYKKDETGTGYYLQYASVEDGQYMYINRPLKFIELSDENKDVVAFDIKVELNTIDRMEFLNMSRSTVDGTIIENLAEKDFDYIPLKKYDKSIWQQYGVIEPIEEMKRFETAD